MQSITEVIETLARQRARQADGGRGDPLLGTLSVDEAVGERIAHLPIDAELSQAWMALTGEPFRPHQAHALTALRRGEPVALRAASADVVMTGYLLLYAMLHADRAASALVVPPDAASMAAARAHLAQINEQLPRNLSLPIAYVGPNRRPDLYARVILASPEVVHSRLLRHHDRAWRLFWPNLQMILVPEIQRYKGVAAAQLADLLVRCSRVAAAQKAQPHLLATMEDVGGADETLSSLLGHTWRVVSADDGPRNAATLAVWRAGTARLRDAADLAIALQRNEHQVHLFCDPFDQPQILATLGDMTRLTFGSDLAAADVLVVAGFPGSTSLLRRMLRARYKTVVLVLGDLPHEQAIAQRINGLLSDSPPVWATPTPNAYILAKNVLCAATEMPLTADEVAAWGVSDIVERLETQGQLVDLPDAEVAWKPTDAAGDPYEDWSLHSSTGEMVVARTEQGQPISTISPDQYDRWAFPKAALPPGVGAMRVLSRDEETWALTMRQESGGRRTYPLRRCTVTLRETRDTRTLPGSRPLGWGRVVVEEEIYGFREHAVNGAPADIALSPAQHTRWTAPACWFDLVSPLQMTGQFVGWTLAAALPLRTLAAFTDIVPCYDHEHKRLYIVDAQPGGNGLALWLYAHAEDVLTLAHDIAHACRTDPLLEPLSRVDRDWLLALLGPQGVAQKPELVEPKRKANVASGKIEYVTAPDPPPYEPPPMMPPIPERKETSQPVVKEPPPSRTEKPRPPIERPERSERAEQLRLDSVGDAPPRATGNGRDLRGDAVAPEPPKESNPPARPLRPERPAERPPERPPERAPDSEPSRRAPAAPRQPAPESEAPADANALIARLRRQREQREAHQQPARTPGRWHSSESDDNSDVEQRFQAGDTVFCLPYGDGVVQMSRVEAGRELLTVEFPTYGELEIDPAVSLVRKTSETAPEEDN